MSVLDVQSRRWYGVTTSGFENMHPSLLGSKDPGVGCAGVPLPEQCFKASPMGIRQDKNVLYISSRP